MATSGAESQRKLKKFIERRHPHYEEMLPQWNFFQETYEGGRAWFTKHIHQYLKEGPNEYKDRVDRAYRFNHTREVCDLVDKYLFKMDIKRNHDNAPESVKRFWKKATLAGRSIRDFMRQVSNRSSVFGRVWIVIDRPAAQEVAEVRTVADEKRAQLQTYAYIVPPQDALDMSFDDKGQLNWILLREIVREDDVPIESTGEVKERFRLWTRTYSQLFLIERIRTNSKETRIVQEPPVAHDLGVVPVLWADNVLTDSLYTSPSMIADVAYLDRACANYLSNMDAIIQDQTFSQLAMPAQGLSPGDESAKKLLEMGTKRIFLFNGEGNSAPFYLSPDVKQAEMILRVINKIINEIYHSVGLAGERTKEDNSQGIDNSSGVAKAYDFERVNSLLALKADSLEAVENHLAEMVALWNGEKIPEKVEPLVGYPDEFDVRGLYDEFEISARLMLIEAPELMRRTQMERVADKLFPQIDTALREQMSAELKDWPPDPIEQMAEMTAAKVSAGGTPGSSAGGGATVKEQGRNSVSNKLVSTSTSKRSS